MATENTKQTQPRPWQPPRYETPEERSRREEREANARFLVDTLKQALDEYFTERAEDAKARKAKDPISAFLGLD
jgi:hypothetical protein